MGKKKNKKKKINPKRERYAKFRKEKPSVIDYTAPELGLEQQKQKQEDEKNINMFLKYNKRKPNREVLERKTKSKR